MSRQQGASPSIARHQILNIFIIQIELKSYVPSVLKHYNEMYFNVLHEEIRSIKLFQIGLIWFRLFSYSNNRFYNKLLYNNKFYNKFEQIKLTCLFKLII